MKNKKILITSIIIFIMVVTVIVSLLIFNNSNRNTTFFVSKVNNLKALYENDSDIDSINLDQNIVILSVSDKHSQAIVKNSIASSINIACNNATNEMDKYINEKRYNPEWVKLDIVNDIQEITLANLEHEIKNTIEEYTYRKGIIIKDNNKEIVLTEAELNSNMIYNYEKNIIDLNLLNLYLKDRGISTITNLPNKLEIFTTISYFCDENNICYKLCSDGNNTGRRIQDITKSNDINSIVDNSANYLANMIHDSGKFIYGYYPLQSATIENYNIVRHAGSLWALLLLNNENSNNFKEKIDKAYNYLNSQIVKKDEDTYYIIEEKNDEIKLGANALATIAVCEYANKYNAVQDVEIAKKLANGILNMQNSNGSYIHVLNSNDFSQKDASRTVYYDGEATFALVKIYSLTKDEKYLVAAQNAIKYFIDNNYEQYGDHWLQYAMNELTNYTDNEKYYEFALRTVEKNINQIHYKKYTSHTDFEFLMQSYEIYNKIIDKHINIEYLSKFDSDIFIEAIKEKAANQLNSFFYPEIAMYTKQPDKYLDSFFVRHSDFRIRIDDIQHSSVGFSYYLKNLNKLNNN